MLIHFYHIMKCGAAIKSVISGHMIRPKKIEQHVWKTKETTLIACPIAKPLKPMMLKL